MSEQPSVGGGVRTLPMSVDNVGFLLDRLGQDCHPLQYLRELTQNSIEAIKRTGEPGQIVWDVDWIQYDLSAEKLYKLCVSDTGDGMTGPEMMQFINQLSSSVSEQSFSGNYGVGAKISAATRHPFGVVYQSWKDGVGAMIHLERNRVSGQYGLRQWQWSDGSYAYYLPLEDDVKPEIISAHGTKVILFGASYEANTMDAPPASPSPSRWTSKYLNTRYFRFPEGISVKAREGWQNPRSDTDRNVLRSIAGQEQYLNAHSLANGEALLGEAKVRWWILKDEPALTNNSGYIESAGHAAALYQGELYDRATSRAGTARLQQFGVIFGARFVVLYVEPLPDTGRALTTNTSRTSLLLDGEELPWADWALEFRENMPQTLLDFVNEKASGSTKSDHVKSIKERLKSIMDLYKVSRYRPTPTGDYLSDETTSVRVGSADSSAGLSSPRGSGSRVGSEGRGARDGELGNIYYLFEKKDGTESTRLRSDPFPQVRWVSLTNGTRTEDDMEDKAAKYIAEQNLLLVNSDFRVYTDLSQRLAREWDDSNVNVIDVVRDVVRGWFEQALVETVIGIQALKGSKEWGPEQIDRAVSEEALTATVMQRYHIHVAARRDLGAKLGRKT